MSDITQAARAWERATGSFNVNRRIVTAVLGYGDGSTVKVDGHEGYHWARLHGKQSELTRVLNRETAAVYDLQVLVAITTEERQGGQTTYEVLSTASNDIMTNGGTVTADPYLPEHAPSHIWNTLKRGRDVVDVYNRMIVDLRVYADNPASMRCRVRPGLYTYGTAWKQFSGNYTQDFTSEIPSTTGKAKLAYICVNGATNTLAYVYSSEFDWTGYTDSIPPTAINVTITPGYVLISSPILYNGMTSITEACFRYEVRPIFHAIGSSGAMHHGTEAEWMAITDKTPYAWQQYWVTDTVPQIIYGCDGAYWYKIAELYPVVDQALGGAEGGFITDVDGNLIPLPPEV